MILEIKFFCDGKKNLKHTLTPVEYCIQIQVKYGIVQIIDCLAVVSNGLVCEVESETKLGRLNCSSPC